MLCLGPKKSLSSLRLKLLAQGMAQRTDDQSQVWYHSAIQAQADKVPKVLHVRAFLWDLDERKRIAKPKTNKTISRWLD